MLQALVWPGLIDLLDIALVAGLGWLALRSLRLARARSALIGLALVTLVYLVAQGLELRLTAALLQGFFAVVVIVLVVVFQEDLRRFFEGLGTWRPGRSTRRSELELADLLGRAVSRLASTRTGALIVLPGEEPIDRHLAGGVPLRGLPSEPLLLSLFDASSPGHDGAVVIRDGKVERFAVHLPLSSNHDAIGAGGTRHAAALGLSERCDAIAIAVSEERGTVSVARHGELVVLDRPEDLAREIQQREPEGEASESGFRDRQLRDALVAVAASFALWMVVVPGSDTTERTLSVPIAVSNLPSDLALETIDPEEVEVTLRGRRRDILLAERAGLAVQVDAYLARLGRRTFTLTSDAVSAPDAVDVLSIEPQKIRLSLQPAEEPGPEDAAP